MYGILTRKAKNVALAGVKTITLHDTQNATWTDLASQFFVTEADLGKNRAVLTQPKVSELNP